MDDNTKAHDPIAMKDLEKMVAALVEKGLEARVVLRTDGRPYLVIQVGTSFHVFREVETKQAAKNCGSVVEARQSNEIWKTDYWTKEEGNRFVLTSIEGIKLIHSDGREELISEMTPETPTRASE